MRAFWHLQLVGMVALGIAPTDAQGPAIHGFNGTMALDKVATIAPADAAWCPSRWSKRKFLVKRSPMVGARSAG